MLPLKAKHMLGMVSQKDGSFETMYQNLHTPLKYGKCYLFSIEIAVSSNFITQGFSYFDYTNLSALEIWGTDTILYKT